MQRDLRAALLQRRKREFSGSLNETKLCDNKKLWVWLRLYYQIRMFLVRKSL